MIIKVFDGYESKYTGVEVDKAIGRAQYAVAQDTDNVFTGLNEFRGTVVLGTNAVVATPEVEDNPLKVANLEYIQSQGFLKEIDSEMIGEALGFTPENVANKVTALSAGSTDTEFPSAKCVYAITSANTSAIQANTSNIISNTSTIAINTSNIALNTQAISTINSKIPSTASSTNQLTDTNFVNSSIATNTAYFIGTFNSVAELEAYSGTLTNNDYAFVKSVDTAGNTLYNRYKYNSSTQTWIFEYALNNSSFTSAQWAAINSGATISNISQIATNTSSISSLATNKQDVITDLATIRAGATAGSTALQPNDNISELVNNAGYLTTVTSAMVTNSLGYTPYNGATNPNGYQANTIETIKVNGTAQAVSSKSVDINVPTSTTQLTNDSGYITGISSSDVTAALGFTPYNGATNPNGYITGITSNMVTTALGYTPENSANLSTIITSESTNDTYPSAKAVYNAIQGSAGVTSLENLSDVSITSPSQGQNLTYDAITGKWKNTATSATVAWGGLTGNMDDQTDLKNALAKKTTKFSTVNPALTSSDGKCTWTITNEIGSKKVQVDVYEVSTYQEILADIKATDSTVSIELISANDITANSYEVVVVG